MQFQNNTDKNSKQNCSKDKCCEDNSPSLSSLPMYPDSVAENNEPCCGAKQGPPASPFERPGYNLCHFVKDFQDTKVGRLPRLSHDLYYQDWCGSIRARLGISRDQYKISPGLYCLGLPDSNSPVLVTANYKLTFDSLRKNSEGIDAWLLVLDTRGVNVWCAAGKKNFSTFELINKVKSVELDKLVNHRQLVLPQLGAPGVDAHSVKKGCGFKVVWGPIRVSDLKEFIGNGLKVSRDMRSLTFSLAERLVLVPVEISLILKISLYIVISLFVLSGITGFGFSVSNVIERGSVIAIAYATGVLSGAVIVPAFLPFLPFRSFYLKGIVSGLLTGILLALAFTESLVLLELIAVVLISVTVSSYAAMNFTGATPFTSPSGVEKEMRRGIPLQGGLALMALICWIWAGVM